MQTLAMMGGAHSEGWVLPISSGRLSTKLLHTPSPQGWRLSSRPALPAQNVRDRGTGTLSVTLATVAAAAGAATAAGRRRRLRRGIRSRKLSMLQAQAQEIEIHDETLCKESDAPESMRRRFEAVCREAQERICSAIEDIDGRAKFCRDAYTRESGGGGISRVLADGDVFEKAGVNLSVVYGKMSQEALQAAQRGDPSTPPKETPETAEPRQELLGGVPFFACGLSSVMHPKNPHCPTMHFNYRYFETANSAWWFGGGTDITPSYLDKEDMAHFHGTYKAVCDRFDASWYPRFKAWADRYFRIEHRGETRGLGGIFFDDFNTQSPEEHLRFSTECLKAVTEAYCPILEKNKSKPYSDEEKAWQQMRRGRYVEFNLVYDRGTVFGLKMLPSGVGRIESILMSLPETARWQYCHEPEPGSPEAEIMEAFKSPQEWI